MLTIYKILLPIVICTTGVKSTGAETNHNSLNNYTNNLSQINNNLINFDQKNSNKLFTPKIIINNDVLLENNEMQSYNNHKINNNDLTNANIKLLKSKRKSKFKINVSHTTKADPIHT